MCPKPTRQADGRVSDMAHKSQFVWSEALPSPAKHLIHNNLTDFPSDLLISPLFPSGIPTAAHSFPDGLKPTKQHFLFVSNRLQLSSESVQFICESLLPKSWQSFPCGGVSQLEKCFLRSIIGTINESAESSVHTASILF